MFCSVGQVAVFIPSLPPPRGLLSSPLGLDLDCEVHGGHGVYYNHLLVVIFSQTNNPTFPLLHSRIRRRYSEFVWLKNKLGLEDVVFKYVMNGKCRQFIICHQCYSYLNFLQGKFQQFSDLQ